MPLKRHNEELNRRQAYFREMRVYQMNGVERGIHSACSDSI